ncbi:hypothetical protein H123_25933 [Pseudomonas aeruginosa PA21_ST175]|nr:hypothetical protein H123_25933 [Pseudomonas aeruginosa PA21_ST175]
MVLAMLCSEDSLAWSKVESCFALLGAFMLPQSKLGSACARRHRRRLSTRWLMRWVKCWSTTGLVPRIN